MTSFLNKMQIFDGQCEEWIVNIFLTLMIEYKHKKVCARSELNLNKKNSPPPNPKKSLLNVVVQLNVLDKDNENS